MSNIEQEITTRNLKNGGRLVTRATNALYDSLWARTNEELKDMIAFAKQINQTNCGWQEFGLQQILIMGISEILKYREKKSPNK